MEERNKQDASETATDAKVAHEAPIHLLRVCRRHDTRRTLVAASIRFSFLSSRSLATARRRKMLSRVEDDDEEAGGMVLHESPPRSFCWLSY
jgi:hypothetical protein